MSQQIQSKVWLFITQTEKHRRLIMWHIGLCITLNVYVCDSTIRKSLNKYEKVPGSKPISTTRISQYNKHLQNCIWKFTFWNSISLWLIRPRWRCLAIKYNTMFGENQIQHIITNTLYHLSNVVMEEWWFGLISLPQHLRNIQSLKHTGIVLRQMWGHMSSRLTCAETGSCNRTMILKTPANWHLNG